MSDFLVKLHMLYEEYPKEAEAYESDYNLIAARLAEAERLLRGVAAVGYDGPAWEAIEVFLQPADSAEGGAE